MQQLEGAIAALRGIVSNVASNDALARLADDVHTLSAKVDQLSRSERQQRFLCHARAAHRRAELDAGEPAAAGRERPLGISRKRAALADRAARPHPGRQRQCVGLCPSRTARNLSAGTPGSLRPPSAPASDLGRVEEGLHDILRSLERQHANLVSLAESNRNADAPQPMDSGIVDLVKRELSDIRFSQSETDRRTQDLLETVHSTLGHVVDRLAMIEGDLRTVRPRRVAPQPAPAPVEMHEESAARADAVAGLRATVLAAIPDAALDAALCAAAETGIAESGRIARQLSGAFCRRAARIPRRAAGAAAIPPIPPRAISEILEPHAAPPRTAIAPELPPDHPLEPGTRPAARMSSPSERIAASESAISEIAAAPRSRSVHRASLPPRAAPRRPPPPRRLHEKAGRAAAKAASKAASKGRRQDQGRRQDPLEHLVQDPLAAGRRERGRDRARHLQDGDDAARHRQRAANAADGKFGRAGRPGAGSRGEQRQARACRRPLRPR